MSAASDALREFHKAFGIPPGETTTSDVVRGRAALHAEEHGELMMALATAAVPFREPTVEALERLAEELADVMVVAYGTADVLGINLDRAFAIKMAANMAKLPDCPDCHPMSFHTCGTCGGTGKGKPIKREDGKVLKPEGWQKPSMAEAIR